MAVPKGVPYAQLALASRGPAWLQAGTRQRPEGGAIHDDDGAAAFSWGFARNWSHESSTVGQDTQPVKVGDAFLDERAASIDTSTDVVRAPSCELEATGILNGGLRFLAGESPRIRSEPEFGSDSALAVVLLTQTSTEDESLPLLVVRAGGVGGTRLSA